MAMKIDIVETNISASQLSEFFRLAALPNKHINRATFQMYLEGRNPFALERNENGHVMITFIGINLTGTDEMKRLRGIESPVGEYAKSCLKSKDADSYDKKHRLVTGQTYKIALVSGKEIDLQSERTTPNTRKLGEKYGYGEPLGGHIPHIRQCISEKQMLEVGFRRIVSLHDPIKESDGPSSVLNVHLLSDGLWVGTCQLSPDREWPDGTAFAFPMISK